MGCVRLVSRSSSTNYVNPVLKIHRQTARSFHAVAGKISRVGESVSSRIQLAHECVRPSTGGSALKGRPADGEIGGSGGSRQHHVESGIHRDSGAGIRAISTEVG